jgi:hypothetical protein
VLSSAPSTEEEEDDDDDEKALFSINKEAAAEI